MKLKNYIDDAKNSSVIWTVSRLFFFLYFYPLESNNPLPMQETGCFIFNLFTFNFKLLTRLLVNF